MNHTTNLMTNLTTHLAAESVNSIPVALNLTSDSSVSESKPLSSGQRKSEAESISISSVNPGPQISSVSDATSPNSPVNPVTTTQLESMDTATTFSASRHALNNTSVFSLDDFKFLGTSGLRGLEYARIVAERAGWRLSGTPEEVIERRVEWFRDRLIHGQPPLSDEQKVVIKANKFRGRGREGK